MTIKPRHSILSARIIFALLCTAFNVAAHSDSKLSSFVEAKGCKLYGAEAIVKRLNEIAAEGSVTWEGKCKNGVIEGKGVLREEGALISDGKTKNYAYFFSGVARKGLRQGKWKRETYDRYADSPKFYTSAATLKFADGVAKGKPDLLKLESLDQLTPRFRQFVIDAQREAKPANPGLLFSNAERPAEVAPLTPPPAKARSGKTQNPVPPAPKSVYSYFPRVTTSSHFEQYGAEGLMTFQRPGWYSAKPPDFPEWILVDFRSSRDVTMIGMLAEDDHQARAPKIIRIESSQDGKTWSAMIASEIPCAPNSDGGWLNLGLLGTATGRYLKIVILANCGDPEYISVRGLRFK